MLCDVDAWLAMDRTVSVCLAAAVAGGICALICPAAVTSSGIAVASRVTQELPRMVGRVPPGGCAGVGREARPVDRHDHVGRKRGRGIRQIYDTGELHACRLG